MKERTVLKLYVSSLIAIGIAALAILLTVVTSGCATTTRPPGLSVEGALAIDGKKVTDGIANAARLVDTAYAGGLSAVTAYAIMQPLHVAATEAVKLADVLALIDTARTDTEKAAGIAKAKPLLLAVRQALLDGLIPTPVSVEPVVAQIKAVIGVILALMDTFQIGPVADLQPWETLLLASRSPVPWPLAALPILLLMQMIPHVLEMYKTERARWVQAHPGADVPFPTDAELIANFKASAVDAQTYTGALLEKYRAAMGDA